MTKKILVLGAGIGGVIAATVLAKKLKRDRVEITIVDRHSTYVFAPSYLWVMTGQRSLDDISVPIAGLQRKGIKFVQGDVQQIDPATRSATVSGQVFQADYLIVALGAETHMTGLETLTSVGANLYSSEGSTLIEKTRHSARGKDVAIVICSMPFKCPAAPYEAAMLLSQDLKAGTRVSVYSPEPGPMPVAGPKVSAQMVDALTYRNVKYFPQRTIKGLSASNQLEFQDGSTAPFDLLIYVPKHRVPKLLIDCGLATEGGWVPVDRSTLETKFPGVYVIGDAAGIPLKNGKALPKAGVFAHGQGEVVARNIAHLIQGKPATQRFEGFGQCFVEMGGGIAGRGYGNFYAEPDPQISMAKPGPWNHWAKLSSKNTGSI